MYAYLPIFPIYFKFFMSLESRNIYHINEEISHLKCHFSHPGSFTHIPLLHILENQREWHQKSANIFSPEREMCR